MADEQLKLPPMPTGTPPRKVIRDPIIAAGMARCACWQLDPKRPWTRAAHPGPCKFCKVPLARKIEVVTEFNDWSGLNPLHAWANLSAPPGEKTPIRPEVEAFMQLPREEQRRLVLEAAGVNEVFPDLEPEPEPEPRPRTRPGRTRGDA